MPRVFNRSFMVRYISPEDVKSLYGGSNISEISTSVFRDISSDSHRIVSKR